MFNRRPAGRLAAAACAAVLAGAAEAVALPVTGSPGEEQVNAPGGRAAYLEASPPIDKPITSTSRVHSASVLGQAASTASTIFCRHSSKLPHQNKDTSSN